ncbi:hypothetical protein ITP53_04650 [Nonomuraea sp. K274]|uniref:Uncharacterized protein n=1 Tax=Nonomuraea cypriaca TaxID=1187855 RepID=A0A931A4M8_9ACTN|nr:hypothetical protein [Nonomuraea cypriaca]MBF8185038.1 hypothetical protein [Nonomuraea cypriaca]
MNVTTRATVTRFSPRTVIALVVACAAGAPAAGSVVDAARAYHDTHRQVVVRVVEEGAIVAGVTWRDEAGVRRDGRVRAPLDRVSGTEARIWLDRRGRPAPRPLGPVEAVFAFLLAGFLAGAATWRMSGLRHHRRPVGKG